ncbi:MAG: hypothetical protein V9H69_05095 [Anaerolineae bacterium]
MGTSNSVHVRSISAGDAAVAGLLYGLVAGLAMAAFLVLAGLTQGQTPASVLGVFTISGEPNVLTGLLGHLAVAGVYGLVWGLAWRLMGPRLRVPAILAGPGLWTAAVGRFAGAGAFDWNVAGAVGAMGVAGRASGVRVDHRLAQPQRVER